MTDNPQNRYGTESNPSNTLASRTTGTSLFGRRSAEDSDSQNVPARTTTSVAPARPSNSLFGSRTSTTATSTAANATKPLAPHQYKSGNAIASVMRKTSYGPQRAQFTPSDYPGITKLAIASQRAGYDSVAARNPDILPTTQDRLQVSK